jgi:hypothetical protein
MLEDKMVKLLLCLGRKVQSCPCGWGKKNEFDAMLKQPIAVDERSKARTVFARSTTAIVGSNPTEAWMFVCVLCAFFLFLHSLK